MYSPIVSAKMNDIDPQAWLAHVLTNKAQQPIRRIAALELATARNGGPPSSLIVSAHRDCIPKTWSGSMSIPVPNKLEDFRAPVNIKLASLWTSLMFLYIYNDYFAMYTPGTINDMAKGNLGPMGHASEALLTGLSIMLAIPSLMIFLSAVLTAWISRWLNVALGIVYTAIEVLTLFGAPLFYRIVVIAEITLTLLIVWYALRWPKQASSA